MIRMPDTKPYAMATVAMMFAGALVPSGRIPDGTSTAAIIFGYQEYGAPTSPAMAQELAPEMLLLSRIKRQIKQELRQLPNISCLETIEREYKPAKGKLRERDIVRLEVLTNGTKEFYASPGDRKFSEQPPISFAGSGAMGNGIFGLYLRDILLGGFAAQAYKGEEEIAGRKLARFDYRLPQPWSGQTIRTPDGAGSVGLHGSFWADTQTNEVVRLELAADDIPLSLPIAEMFTRIDYIPTDLGHGTAVLLPRSAEFRMTKLSGEINVNRVAFSGCHVFEAQSKIDFSAPEQTAQPPKFGIASADDILRELPGGMRIEVKLRSRISADMAVGAAIHGVVAENVPERGGVAIPAGSTVSGRLRRLEHIEDPVPCFVVGLEYTELKVRGIRYHFHAEVAEIQPARGVERKLMFNKRVHEYQETGETLSFRELPGVATFFYTGPTLDLPLDFRTVWKTVP
jgi:hypothetical protein